MTRPFHLTIPLCIALFTALAAGAADLPPQLQDLPVWPGRGPRPSADWLLNPAPFKAGLFRGAAPNEIVLANGLIARTFRLTPNAATIALDNLITGEALLRGVKPEALLEIDGRRYEIGGLKGQPNYAFLSPDWLDQLRANPAAFRFVGLEIGRPAERLAWKRVRRHAPGVKWPPDGISLRLDFAMPAAPPSNARRPQLISDDFLKRDPAWRTHVSPAHPRSSFQNEGKLGEIYTPANTAVFVERPLPPETRLVELTLDPGTDRSASWGPGLALAGRNGILKFHLRPGGSQGDTSPQFGLLASGSETLLSGKEAGLDLAKPLQLRLRWDEDQLLCEYRPVDSSPPPNPPAAGPACVADWRIIAQLPLAALPAGPLTLRAGKLSRAGAADDFNTPGDLVRLRILQVSAFGPAAPEPAAPAGQPQGLRVSVHYELYDGLPCYSKWLTLSNATDKTVRVDRFSSEILAAVERLSEVDELTVGKVPPPIHVETDMAFGGMTAAGANRRSFRWIPDPDFHTQVNYEKKTPCLLDVGPDLGPATDLPPGQTFESFRAWVLPFDSTDRERQGLAMRRMYRAIAPWATENPLMMHCRFSDERTVTAAIDQCAEVGFEMLILTFGSGFDLENPRPETLARARKYAAYARAKGVEIGSYSLLASRSIGAADDVVMPPGQAPTFGNSPCLGSPWGQGYFRRLYDFHRDSGFTLLEHDGSYPGDVCQSEKHPGHRALADSRWTQWRTIASFYAWCRAQGIYLNVPDHYFLAGSSKTGMGYREVNWSLPRDQQVIHTRQNIFDGTWEKTPTMGWMFVPLTEYQGGGAAATIEPLDQHLDHYERMLTSNLALGVQACYRGPRLYDTDRTRAMLKRWVGWFKAHRDILESDLIHGRRADARDLDWMLHVNPALKEKGLLVVFNPLAQPLQRTLHVNLYYTGLSDTARISDEGAPPITLPLQRDYAIDLPVQVPPRGMKWFVIE